MHGWKLHALLVSGGVGRAFPRSNARIVARSPKLSKISDALENLRKSPLPLLFSTSDSNFGPLATLAIPVNRVSASCRLYHSTSKKKKKTLAGLPIPPPPTPPLPNGAPVDMKRVWYFAGKVVPLRRANRDRPPAARARERPVQARPHGRCGGGVREVRLH